MINKENNIITVEFGTWDSIVAGEYPKLLHQYDTGQVIRMEDIPDNTLIEFKTKKIEKALIRFLHNHEVEIPNELLRYAVVLDIYATVSNENEITTKKKLSIQITKRPDREAEIHPEDQPGFIEQISSLVEEAVSTAVSVRTDADNHVFDGHTPVKGTDYFTDAEIEEIEENAAEKVDLSGLVPNSRKIGDESLNSDITKDKLGREVTKALVTGGSWYGMLIPWLISQCGSKLQQDSNSEDIASLRLSSGHSLAISMDSTNYVMTISLLNMDGTVIDTKSIDFPLESVVVSGSYNNQTKEVQLTLQNGSVISFSVGDLVSGLVTENELETELQGTKAIAANKIQMIYDQDNYVIQTTIKNQAGQALDFAQVNLPLGWLISSVAYNAIQKSIGITYLNGTESSFSIAALIDGLATETMVNNGLATKADKVDDDWKLLRTINIAELAEPTSMFIFSKDDQGNDIAVDDIQVSILDVISSKGASIAVQLTTDKSENTFGGIIKADSLSTTTARRFEATYERMIPLNNWRRTVLYYSGTGYQTTSFDDYSMVAPDNPGPDNKINSVKIYAYNSANFVSGTIKIYGRNRR